MTIKLKRTDCAPALAAAIKAHAAAMAAGDDRGAAAFVNDQTEEDCGVALRRASSMRPFIRHDVIALARLGFQYLVKLRLHGQASDLTLQIRWAVEHGQWRIVELDDLGLRSPWQQPQPRAKMASAYE